MESTMEVYNRQFLKEYRGARYQWIQNETRIITRILQTAAGGRETRYLIDGREFMYGQREENITEWVVARLKERFPDSIVEYRQATELNGRVQHGIVIDWS
jgi:hypothetical protein